LIVRTESESKYECGGCVAMKQQCKSYEQNALIHSEKKHCKSRVKSFERIYSIDKELC
jgi:hypothetical protein